MCNSPEFIIPPLIDPSIIDTTQQAMSVVVKDPNIFNEPWLATLISFLALVAAIFAIIYMQKQINIEKKKHLLEAFKNSYLELKGNVHWLLGNKIHLSATFSIAEYSEYSNTMGRLTTNMKFSAAALNNQELESKLMPKMNNILCEDVHTLTLLYKKNKFKFTPSVEAETKNLLNKVKSLNSEVLEWYQKQAV